MILAATAVVLAGLAGWVLTRPALGVGAEGAPAIAVAPAALLARAEAGEGLPAVGVGTQSGAPDATTPTPTATPTTAVNPMVPVAVAPSWAARIASATGIPLVAVTAYADATLREGQSDPGCALSWNTLAGIGEVESGQGTHGGARLEADGEDSAAILGPALNGSGSTTKAANMDPAVDGSGAWARAVGPLQFLPSTWQQWGADGNGDGIRDPSNIFDAARAAADYLCSSGQSLTTGPGWSAAVLSYNHETSYVNAVRDAANRYAEEADS
ncbi:lytic transglycosylase domain-containing protein [Gryllotalpicola reticulitermitis]|uniref:Lytic transglycosylase domain-containing protein n=1 Tax=Gryllotalpicola reticulitermitis TaxID=1184153 RepID=A0ABV8QCL3_9MICO